MHPGMMAWWKHARGMRGCGNHMHWGGGCGHSSEGPEVTGFSAGEGEGDFGSGAFGVRRPLRFLAYKLNLSEAQVGELAAILNDLKTERAQASVDNRRTTAAYAEAIAANAFDEERLREAAHQRVKSAEHLRDATVRAMGRIHSLLDATQRAQLAYLIRTGALII